MAQPIDASRPRLARGCRLRITNNDNDAVVLFPEGALRLEGPGRQILEHCDGQRTFQEIVGTLQALYIGAGHAQVREDTASFLDQLQQQRIVDY
jgi:pyrroloquinoline quinone biosynthesis protein D